MPPPAAAPSRPAALSATLEDYLEAILELVRESSVARSRDIAGRLGVHKSTVTAALRSLGDLGLIHYAPYEVIRLTPEGEQRARDVLHRHEALRDFFVDVLGVARPVAEKAACAMEHSVPKELLQRMADFSAFLRDCPQGRAWNHQRIRHAQQSDACDGGIDHSRCDACLRKTLTDFDAAEAAEAVADGPSPRGRKKNKD